MQGVVKTEVQVGGKRKVQVKYNMLVRVVAKRQVRAANNNKVREFGTFYVEKFVCFDEIA